MKKNKLMLDELVSTDFLLVGINASTEMYQLAYFINKEVNINLQRAEFDIDFYYKDAIALFPWYEYYSKELQSKVYFVANKSYSREQKLNPTGNLFSKETNEEYRIRHLIPELKTVDYFIKIEEATLDQVNYKSLLYQLNSIKQIATAYQIDNNIIKTPENLIFH
ncbi:IPExxxVDY family protein [Psychroflexus planctonicus]|nr:IPExxxVDY family protein [Psychroflexus planctonicus]